MRMLTHVRLSLRARKGSATPTLASNSSVRACMPIARGSGAAVGLASIMWQDTPRLARHDTTVSPVGRAPTTTSTFVFSPAFTSSALSYFPQYLGADESKSFNIHSYER